MRINCTCCLNEGKSAETAFNQIKRNSFTTKQEISDYYENSAEKKIRFIAGIHKLKAFSYQRRHRAKSDYCTINSRSLAFQSIPQEVTSVKLAVIKFKNEKVPPEAATMSFQTRNNT